MELTAVQTSNVLYFRTKRLWDFCISAVLLVLLSPVFLVVSILIRLDSPGPVIFTQKRVGCKIRCQKGSVTKEVTTFTFYKFRSMYHRVGDQCHRDFIDAYIHNDQARMDQLQNGSIAHENTFKLNHDPRITRIGSFLRKSSLDEIPQFWNVLKGDMSLVGPRPPIPYEVDIYAPWHHGRLLATPGITGLWQVSARNSTNFDEMVQIDIDYIQQQSFWLDLKILLNTPFAIFKNKGC